ncbi:hypothetical protein FA13DRAFT_714242 [Coprinellus micaceus]|uniref:Uncharacterized protein n=1 Tax=Coprinellus micaceus TaxID=71717 RepID=A0A4Y7TWG6_COPMI|nr:hypothetical protein FA13DRAFT_714242 [Coprinellus micaceus]
MPSSTPPATSEQARQFLRGPREFVRGVFRTSERGATFGVSEGLGASIGTALPIAAGPVTVPPQPTLEGLTAQDAPPVRGWKTDLRTIGRRFVPIAEVGASVAEAVPIFGAPVKAALEGLVKVLNLIEQKCQNIEGINQLLQKLEDLEGQLKACAESENTRRLTRFASPFVLARALGTHQTKYSRLSEDSRGNRSM